MIQNLKIFANFILNLTRIEFLDPKSDTLSKNSIKNFFEIQFLRRSSFLRKHRKGNFDLFTVYNNIFSENEFRKRIWFLKTILLEIVMRCNIVESEPDTLKNSTSKNWQFSKMLIGRRTRHEKFGSTLFLRPVYFLRFIFFEEALNCHLWKFYRVFLPICFSKASFATEFDFIKKHISTWKLDAL